jgi:DNA polymerase
MAADRDQLRAYVDYLRDMGVHDLYRLGKPIEADPAEPVNTRFFAGSPSTVSPPASTAQQQPASQPPLLYHEAAPHPALHGPVVPSSTAPSPAVPGKYVPDEISMPKPISFNVLAPLPEKRIPVPKRPAALQALREEIGDCTRCPLAYAGRHTIVFGNGDPGTRLMFVGEGPGADEDATGEPFVGKAGQLLNNMIAAMGLKREEVYVANIVKCRPPANRVPEPIEANTCSQFLLRQIDIVQPQVIVALGGTAATYLLGVKQSLVSLRGKWYDCRGAKLAVTYHPAFLLRDPRQKGEAWKDLQRVMKELGLKPPKKA